MVLRVGLLQTHSVRSPEALPGSTRHTSMAAKSAKLPIFSYSPRLIKKNLAGTGSASKEQVAFMVKALLNLPDVPSSDAADALAIALCHVDTHLNKA